LRAEQLFALAAVRLMASGTPLRKGRLVVHLFLLQISDIGVAAEANLDRIGFWEARLFTGVGVVAVGAVAGGSGMLHLGAFNLFCFFVVAGHAD
jgi:hypothetical protein